ncbi:MAG: hypothetical protein IJH11_07520 [Lachnospiraceae bacterium]|nr:hypothetical protein [Lachnospiraceae bacterium]
MSEKGTASNENAGWLNDIGFTGLIQNSMDYDEIPGFVNSGVFGRFSLDDLDFGDDLTKGRIDFDDEYLLKSPAPGTISFSESSIAKAEPRDSYPKRDSSGGFYHPPHGSVKTAESRSTSYSAEKSKEPHDTIRRQMPTIGRAIQERVFEGLEEVAGELNMDSKLLDSAKSFMDKAPTKWKLFEEQRRSSAINRRQSIRNHQVSLESKMAMESQAAQVREAAPAVKPRPTRQSGRSVGAGRNTGIGRRVSPIAVILIMLLIVRLVAFLFQASTHHINITHNEPDPKPGGTILIGGGDDNNDNQIPDDVAEAFTDLFNDIELWRSDNPYMPWMGLSAEETAALMKEAGWANAEVSENDDVTKIEAELVQDHSEAYILVDNESIGTSFYWNTPEYSDGQAEDEIKAAWGNLFPEDSGIYPGMQLAELRITDEMLQAIRDCGEKNNYGDIEESSLSVNGLFIALFDNEDSWSLYINGDDTYIQLHTDSEEKYLESVYISGETNTWFA